MGRWDAERQRENTAFTGRRSAEGKVFIQRFQLHCSGFIFALNPWLFYSSLQRDSVSASPVPPAAPCKTVSKGLRAAHEDCTAPRALCMDQPLLLHPRSWQPRSVLSPEVCCFCTLLLHSPGQGPGRMGQGRWWWQEGRGKWGRREETGGGLRREDHCLWSIMNSPGRQPVGWKVNDSQTRWRIVLCPWCILSSTGI